MAAIRIRNKSGAYTPWCAGFLIDRRHVLTSAACYRKRDAELYSARIGNVNQDEADEYFVSQITIPESYNGGFYDDIAILKLSKEVNTPNFVPICLPNERIMDMVFNGTGMTAAGWGEEGPRSTHMSRILKVLSEFRFVPNEECNRIFKSARIFPRGLTSGVLCASFPEGGKDVCGGDSGGPLMLKDRSNRWFAIGIVSFGYSCGVPGMPGGYTRVSHYLNWIRQNTKD